MVDENDAKTSDLTPPLHPSSDPVEEDEGRDYVSMTDAPEADQLLLLLQEKEREEAERRQMEANEETTKSEDIRKFIEDMHKFRNVPPDSGSRPTSHHFYLADSDSQSYAPNPSFTAAPSIVNNQPVDLGEMVNDLPYLGPPDGGYGWLVVLGSFFALFAVESLVFSYGIMLPFLSNHTQTTSYARLALPAALFNGIILLCGPLSSALSNQFFRRNVAIIGCLIASIGIFASSFVHNIAAFAVLFGVVGGIGCGLIYVPAITVIGQWFDERRAVAVGIALCGSSLSACVVGLVLPHLLEWRGWSDSVVFLSAIMVQSGVGIVCLRPLEIHERIYMADLVRKEASAQEKESKKEKKRAKKEEKEREKLDNERKKREDKAKGKKIVIRRGNIMMRIMEEKKKQRTASSGSLDGMMITQNNELVTTPSSVAIGDQHSAISTNAVHRLHETIQKKLEKSNNLKIQASRVHSSPSRSGFNRTQSGINQNTLNFDGLLASLSRSTSRHSIQQSVLREPTESLLVQHNIEVGPSPVEPSGCQSNSSQVSLNSLPESQISNFSRVRPILHTIMSDQKLKSEVMQQMRRELHRPQHNKDTYYVGPYHNKAGHKGVASNPNSFSLSRAAAIETMGDMHFNHSTGNLSGQSTLPQYPPSDKTLPYKPPLEPQSPPPVLSPFVEYVTFMFDISLWYSPTFILLAAAGFFIIIGYYIPFVFLPLFARENNLSSSHGGGLLCSYGLANILGRILCTCYISGTNWSTKYWWTHYIIVSNAAIFISGTCLVITPFVGHIYPILVSIAALYGLSTAVFVSLRSLVTVNILGVERLTSAFEFLFVIQGLSTSLGVPIAGALIDATSSFTPCFLFGGVSYFLAGLLSMPMERASLWERKRRSQKVLEEEAQRYAQEFPGTRLNSELPDDEGAAMQSQRDSDFGYYDDQLKEEPDLEDDKPSFITAL